jgi:hypothetical protein
VVRRAEQGAKGGLVSGLLSLNRSKLSLGFSAMHILDNSPLRRPPSIFSRKQMLVLDGIRYAAEMAHIAYERLFDHLQAIAAGTEKSNSRSTATAMLDAWSIIDSAHRFRDLVENLPGLSNSPWKRIFVDRTQDVADLRNCLQHQLGEIESLIVNGGQIWGYLSWAEVRSSSYTGKWLMIAAGGDYVGDNFFFVGPTTPPFFNVPLGRIRLNAFGRQVYLGRTVEELASAVASITAEIGNGALRPVGSPAHERRGADFKAEGFVEMIVSIEPGSNPG